MTPKPTAAMRQFMLAVAHTIVADIAPEELPFFHALAEEYFDDPTPPTPSQRRTDDPLASGFDEFLAAATPAALAMTTTALTYIQHAASLTDPDQVAQSKPAIQIVLRDATRREMLRREVYQTALLFRMPAAEAAEMTQKLVDILAEAVPGGKQQSRVINAWLADHPPRAPFRLHQAYTLHFNVDLPRSDGLVAAAGIDALMAALPPEQEQVVLMVLIEAEGLIIHSPNPQALVVPRQGPSNTIAFVVTPDQIGPVQITAFCSIANHTFQRVQLTAHVGDPGPSGSDAAPSIRASGITLSSALRLPVRHQNMSLIIMKRATGYQFIVQSDTGVRRAFIDISETQIAELIGSARAMLLSIVKTVWQNRPVYQGDDIVIPEEVYRHNIEQLALLGRHLYEKLFYHGRGEDARATGRLLSSLMRSHQFNIKIIADRFVFPWMLLYTRGSDEAIDVDGFWGFKHLIACMPEFSQPEPIQFSPLIAMGQRGKLGFVYDATIDQNRKPDQQLIPRHRKAFQQLAGITVDEYPDRQSLLGLLNDPVRAPQIIYCFCHAHSYLPGDVADVAQSWISVTDSRVTLRDLEWYASPSLPHLAGAPFVFLNACESAKLSPYLYDGLVPYFISRGARGVLGTEANTPAYFAAVFALDLIERLVDGQATLGEILLSLRRTYARQHRNVLGLLYSLYSSNDLMIDRDESACQSG